MKNLSRKELINELKIQMKVFREINRLIEVNKITNEAHELYCWKYLAMGAIDMLKELIKKTK